MLRRIITGENGEGDGNTYTHVHNCQAKPAHAHRIFNNICITIGWLRREIDVGSFRHVHRRFMAGGPRRTRTVTTHAHAQMLYNMDKHSVFFQSYSWRICLYALASGLLRPLLPVRAMLPGDWSTWWNEEVCYPIYNAALFVSLQRHQALP